MLPTPMRPVRPMRTFRWLIMVLATLVLLLTSMAMTAQPREAASVPEHVVAIVLHPFQAVARWVAAQVSDGVAFVQEIGRLRAENVALKSQLAELQKLRVENQVLTEENRALRQELELGQRMPYRLLPAEVLQRDPTNWFSTVVINRGTRDGVRTGMAVINHQGLVGTVVRTTLTTATVRLLSDPGFAVSAVTVPAGETGGVLWRDNRLVIEFPHNPDAAVRPGDAVVTSGLGEHVPRDLFIGVVTTVGMRENNLVKYATVTPGVDLGHLRFVQVVLTEPSAVPESPAGPGQPAAGGGG